MKASEMANLGELNFRVKFKYGDDKNLEVDDLKPSILDMGVQEPIKLCESDKNPEGLPYIYDGNRRHKAVIELIQDGLLDPDTELLVQYKKGATIKDFFAYFRDQLVSMNQQKLTFNMIIEIAKTLKDEFSMTLDQISEELSIYAGVKLSKERLSSYLRLRNSTEFYDFSIEAKIPENKALQFVRSSDKCSMSALAFYRAFMEHHDPLGYTIKEIINFATKQLQALEFDLEQKDAPPIDIVANPEEKFDLPSDIVAPDNLDVKRPQEGENGPAVVVEPKDDSFLVFQINTEHGPVQGRIDIEDLTERLHNSATSGPIFLEHIKHDKK